MAYGSNTASDTGGTAADTDDMDGVLWLMGATVSNMAGTVADTDDIQVVMWQMGATVFLTWEEQRPTQTIWLLSCGKCITVSTQWGKGTDVDSMTATSDGTPISRQALILKTRHNPLRL